MQQLQAKLKNVPVDASQVHCSTSFPLNKEEIPSVGDKVLTCNNLEGNPLQHTGGQNLNVSAVVYVLDMNGSPVMPTSSSRQIRVKNNNAIKPLNFPVKKIEKHYMNNGLIFQQIINNNQDINQSLRALA